MSTSTSHEQMPSSDPSGVATMPGMATKEEINRLRSLSGPEMDVYFLQLILRHHAGGAAMAQYVGERAPRRRSARSRSASTGHRRPR